MHSGERRQEQLARPQARPLFVERDARVSCKIGLSRL